MAVFLDDGFTVPATVKGMGGVCDDLRVVYRPALHGERLKFLNADEGEKFNVAADIVHRHLVDWDARDAAGNKAPLTLAMVRKLAAPLFSELLSLVLCYSAPRGGQPSEEMADAKNS
jgi:hypothetical protein